MTKFKLHGMFPYDRGAKARWLLTELGVEFESRWLNQENPEFNTPEFLKLNPMGRIPVMEIDGKPMFESGAICAYLADLFLDRGMAPALNSPDRAVYQQWMYFAEATLSSFQPRIMIIEDIPEGKLHTDKLAPLQEEVRDAMFTLDQTLSKSEFLVGQRFTAADISVAYNLYWCKLWPELNGEMKDFPRVVAYLDRLTKMPSAQKAKVFSYEG